MPTSYRGAVYIDSLGSYMSPMANGNQGESWVAGVDGCRPGWVVVLRNQTAGQYTARVVATFATVLALPETPSVIAVDMPIGLLDIGAYGGRQCEYRARMALPGRTSSVFSAPSRAALTAFRAGQGHVGLSAANRSPAGTGPGISKQALGILAKIDEVDAVMTPTNQGRVVEVHPELCFAKANGGTPMAHRKKTPKGRDERIQLLASLGFADPLKLLGPRRPTGVAADDLLDACIGCWTATRVHSQQACRLPENPPTDASGLRMEMWW